MIAIGRVSNLKFRKLFLETKPLNLMPAKFNTQQIFPLLWYSVATTTKKTKWKRKGLKVNTSKTWTCSFLRHITHTPTYLVVGELQSQLDEGVRTDFALLYQPLAKNVMGKYVKVDVGNGLLGLRKSLFNLGTQLRGRQTNRQTDRQTNRQTNKKKQRKRARQKREKQRETEGQRERKRDRQTEGQRERKRDRQTETKKE